MISVFCMLAPPFLLSFLRVLLHCTDFEGGGHNSSAVSQSILSYLKSALFLNVISLIFTSVILHPENGLEDAFQHSTSFALGYLLFSLGLAVFISFGEYFVRNHFHFLLPSKNIDPAFLNRDIRIGNKILPFYATLLFLLHFIRIFDNSFWADEGFSIRLAQMSISEMIAKTSTDVHPPLFYLLAQLLYHIFGNHGFTYHLSALLPYGILLILSCTVIKKWFGVIPSAIFITMMSVSQAAVTYNVEVRMYSLAALLVLGSYLSLYKIYTDNRPADWICFCLTSLGAAYTHYYALLAVAFFYLMLLPLLFKDRHVLKRIIVAYIGTVIGYLPWFFYLLSGFVQTADGWWLEDIPTFSNCLGFIFDGKWVFLAFFCSAIFSVLYKTGILDLSVRHGFRLLDRLDLTLHFDRKPCFSMEMLWYLAGIVSIIGTSLFGLLLSHMIRPFLMLRYLYPLTTVAALILGICVSKLHWRRIWASLLLVCLLITRVPYLLNTYRYEEFTLDSGTRKCLESVIPTSDTIIYSNAWQMTWSLFDYYFPNTDYQFCTDFSEIDSPYNRDIIIFWQNPLSEEDLNSFAEKGFYCDLLYSGTFADGGSYTIYRLQLQPPEDTSSGSGDWWMNL